MEQQNFLFILRLKSPPAQGSLHAMRAHPFCTPCCCQICKMVLWTGNTMLCLPSP